MKTTNELKKGTRVELRNGYRATLRDSKRGNTRIAHVEGIVWETGSVYAHDIMYYLEGDGPNGVWHKVTHTPAQVALRKTVRRLFN
jgi:hypothetical protein